MVPMPESVNSSSSTTCATRPSSRWADPTPRSRASRQAVTLGIIPPGEGAVGDERAQLGRRGARDQALGIAHVAQQTGHVGQVDDLLGAQAGRHGSGHGVGVDVVRLAVQVGPDGRQDRDDVLGQQPVEDGRVDRGHVTDEAQLGAAGVGGDQAGVLAGQTDGQRAVHVDGRHDVAVHLAHQDHAGDVERLGIGHPQAVAELGFLAQPGHEIADLGTAAVHHHHPDAHRLDEHDVLGEAGRGLGVDHGVAAVLDDDGRTQEPADVGQGLDQQAGPRAGRGQTVRPGGLGGIRRAGRAGGHG